MEEGDALPREGLGGAEALGVEEHLGDQLPVRVRHRHAPEQHLAADGRHTMGGEERGDKASCPSKPPEGGTFHFWRKKILILRI